MDLTLNPVRHIRGKLYPNAELAQVRLNELLAFIMKDVPKDEHFRATILQPMPDFSMRHIATYKITEQHLQQLEGESDKVNFNIIEWGKEAKGVAGGCATEMRHIFLPDLRDKRHQDFHWFFNALQGRPCGGIFGVPIFLYVPENDMHYCLAVVSATSGSPNILKFDHILRVKMYEHVLLPALLRFFDDMQPYEGGLQFDVLPAKIGLPELVLPIFNPMERINEATDHYKEDIQKSGDDLASQIVELLSTFTDYEKIALLEDIAVRLGIVKPIEPLEDEIISAIDAIIGEIKQSALGKNRDTNYEMALNKFKQHGNQGVPFSELSSLVSTADDPDRTARQLISRLREKLDNKGYVLLHENLGSIYRIVRPSVIEAK